MDTHYLNYILTIAEKHNMTKAAQELYVSQSSLSQYLSKLELELGTPLFLRTRGELVLTPAGELYIKAAQKVLNIKSQLYKDISALENKGNITIGTTSQFGLRILAEVIPLFRSEYPDFTIEISEAPIPMLTKMILDERIDIGLMAANTIVAFPSGTAEILRDEEVWLAVPADHSYCMKNHDRPVTHDELIREFENENFLLAKPGSTLRFLTDRMFRDYQFTPSTMCETNNIPAAMRMAASGAGITFVAESCIDRTMPVAYFHLEPKLFRLNILVRRKSLISGPAEQCFCSYIRGHFQD
ncbi:LysR family transcriptional regulator [Clostridium sp. AM58-1XD]|uniref:LysR family transcriptional regulator n=1 Tax=Clostridium sp. AM58-1XD TaxID=2292307 RepID=UPI000E4CC408|nr:LysR family transcriptional regulator [Clostridium sp. AM58-1XD]RGZ00369.1 LysR family transcriptional regulator [Clostridium sp. AM58-1XD]